MNKKRVKNSTHKQRYSHKHVYRVKMHKNFYAHSRYRRKTDVPTTDNIVNVSNKQLNTTQIRVLNKGLSFVPKPFIIRKEGVLADFNQLARKLRLRYLFRDSNRERSRFKRKSGYTPEPTDNASLELFINTLRENISDAGFEQKQGSNLTINERKALRELMDDNSIVINKADKGSTIVVQNHTDYAQKGLAHLNDEAVYMRLPHDTTEFVEMKVVRLLNQFYREGHINKDMLEFCLPPHRIRTARLYFLLKVHKNPMGIRPIVSCVNNATENLSQYVDIWLQPLMKALPSYIRDTTDFIKYD